MDNIIGSFHHIGYLVKNLDKTARVFRELGFCVSKETYFDEIRKAKICFWNCQGTIIEIIEPTIESDIYPLLKKYANAPYHICYRVPDLSKGVEELKARGFLLFKKEESAPAISPSAKVVFLIHAGIGIIELLQEDEND